MHPITASITLLAAGASAQAPPIPLAQELPPLATLSAAVGDLAAAPPGAWPLGNGRVFAALGRGPLANTLTDLTGPTYDTPTWGSIEVVLATGDHPVEAPDRSLFKVRDCGILIADDRGEGARWTTLDCAPPGSARLLRAVRIEAGAGGLVDAALIARWRTPVPLTAGDGSLSAVRLPHRARLSLPGATPAGNSLLLRLGDLAPGGVAQAVIEWRVGRADGEPAPAPTSAQVLAAARRTLENDRPRRVRFDGSDPHLRNLLGNGRAWIHAQQCTHTGTVVPMLGDRRFDLRRTTGPLLWLLRCGDRDRARALLRAAAARTRPGADGAPWLVLQVYWYWRMTGVTHFAAEHWSQLGSCLEAVGARVPTLESATVAAAATRAMALLEEELGLEGVWSRIHARRLTALEAAYWDPAAARLRTAPGSVGGFLAPCLGVVLPGDHHLRNLHSHLATVSPVTPLDAATVLAALPVNPAHPRASLLARLLTEPTPWGVTDPHDVGWILDALVGALTGHRLLPVRRAQGPILRLAPFLPDPDSWFEARGLHSARWSLDLFVDRQTRMLGPGDLAGHVGHPRLLERDLAVPQDILHFAVALFGPPPPAGAWQLCADTCGTSFQRVLAPGHPVTEWELVPAALLSARSSAGL